jgi:hypothetical protein
MRSSSYIVVRTAPVGNPGVELPRNDQLLWDKAKPADQQLLGDGRIERSAIVLIGTMKLTTYNSTVLESNRMTKEMT